MGFFFYTTNPTECFKSASKVLDSKVMHDIYVYVNRALKGLKHFVGLVVYATDLNKSLVFLCFTLQGPCGPHIFLLGTKQVCGFSQVDP